MSSLSKITLLRSAQLFIIASPLHVHRALSNLTYFSWASLLNSKLTNICIVYFLILFSSTTLLLSISSVSVFSANMSLFEVDCIAICINKSIHYEAYNSFGRYSFITCLINLKVSLNIVTISVSSVVKSEILNISFLNG